MDELGWSAIDLCAGSGWGVACQWLGIDEVGVEIMPEAIATRKAMGVHTVDKSISDLPDAFCRQAPIQIAGPPCQTFSAAGNGEGRKALAEVLRRVAVFGRTGEFIRGGAGDPRTWLVLEPLRLAVHGLPMYVVWEQVRPVLPVWEACGKVLEQFGYSVWTGILSAEQYGVPQTRKRAFLIARRDGTPAAPPVPTHSRYHERSPERLDEGVLPWVSMAEALGWGTPGPTILFGNDAASVHWAPSSMRTGQQWEQDGETVQQERSVDLPSTTITGNTKASHWMYRNGTHANAAERPVGAPAPTVMFGARSNDVRWVQRSNYSSGSKGTPSPVPGSPPLGKRELHEPSSTLTSKGFRWALDRPSTTVLGDPRIAHPGHRDRAGGEAQFSPAQSIRVTVAEAAALQTFPPDHPFQGKSGKQYLQIGNAVPPLLAWHILRMFVQEPDPFAD